MASSAEQQVPSHLKRVVIDNGGHMCKVGFAGQPEPLRCMLNGVVRSKGATGKVYVGDQYDKCPDYSSLQYRRSLERGCLVNWDTQAEVWSRALGADVLNVNPADSSLLLTEIPMCPTAIQDTLDEMVFEHFGFHSYCTRSAPVLAALSIAAEQAKASGGGAPSPAALVVDAGFSATHCVPIFGSVALNYGIKRLNVGGKMLTNHLKQIVSPHSLFTPHHPRRGRGARRPLLYSPPPRQPPRPPNPTLPARAITEPSFFGLRARPQVPDSLSADPTPPTCTPLALPLLGITPRVQPFPPPPGIIPRVHTQPGIIPRVPPPPVSYRAYTPPPLGIIPGV